MAESDFDRVPTKAAQILKETSKVVELKIANFEENKRKSHSHEGKQQNVNKNVPPQNEEGVEFDMRRTRYEVMKFGVSGLKQKSKKKAEVANLVQLGAVAPKKPYRNYKEILKAKQNSKKVRESTLRLRQLGQVSTGLFKRKKKPQKNTNKKFQLV